MTLIMCSFNSNWFDYSAIWLSLMMQRMKVSIPTGSITVRRHSRLLGSFAIVSIPTGSITVLTAFMQQLPRQRFNSNWFDYSLTYPIPANLFRLKFQFQLVRLQW